jgi:hypothetical protein
MHFNFVHPEQRFSETVAFVEVAAVPYNAADTTPTWNDV